MNSVLFGFISMQDAMIIMVVCLVFFGAKRLPELAKGLGQGIREFKKATRDIQDDVESVWREDPAPPRPSAKSLPPTHTEARVEPSAHGEAASEPIPAPTAQEGAPAPEKKA